MDNKPVNTKPQNTPETQPKMSKAGAEYVELSERSDEHCGQADSKCVSFISGGQCKRVAGKINPQGWCKFWHPPTVTPGANKVTASRKS